ncbi:MAG TPA: hypothetical protein VG015_08720, partial [Candidatus Dormibacteraeota bacterium]|jgi:hypothetical protein|nr:hypothetical protein [Candidatus Dormibacteraeota bacterium]
VTLYDVIADLRRERPTPAASRTLDMVVAELGNTRDNLRQAVRHLRLQALPPGGRETLDLLQDLAMVAGLDDLHLAEPQSNPKTLEPADSGTIGILVLMGGASLVAAGLMVAVVVQGLQKAFG